MRFAGLWLILLSSRFSNWFGMNEYKLGNKIFFINPLEVDLSSPEFDPILTLGT